MKATARFDERAMLDLGTPVYYLPGHIWASHGCCSRLAAFACLQDWQLLLVIQCMWRTEVNL